MSQADTNSNRNLNLATPRYYDLLYPDDLKLEYNSNSLSSKYTAEPQDLKSSVHKSNRAKPILEHQEFRCHDEHPINRMNMKYNGLLTSKNSSLKSIKKVTPKRSVDQSKVSY